MRLCPWQPPVLGWGSGILCALLSFVSDYFGDKMIFFFVFFYCLFLHHLVWTLSMDSQISSFWHIEAILCGTNIRAMIWVICTFQHFFGHVSKTFCLVLSFIISFWQLGSQKSSKRAVNLNTDIHLRWTRSYCNVITIQQNKPERLHI